MMPFAPFNQFGSPYGYGYGGAPMAVFGADQPAATPSALDKFKAAMGAQNSIIPVKNGYLLGAGVLGGLLIYGSAEGWFGGRRHHAGGDVGRDRRRHRR